MKPDISRAWCKTVVSPPLLFEGGVYCFADVGRSVDQQFPDDNSRLHKHRILKVGRDVDHD